MSDEPLSVSAGRWRSAEYLLDPGGVYHYTTSMSGACIRSVGGVAHIARLRAVGAAEVLAAGAIPCWCVPVPPMLSAPA